MHLVKRQGSSELHQHRHGDLCAAEAGALPGFPVLCLVGWFGLRWHSHLPFRACRGARPPQLPMFLTLLCLPRCPSATNAPVLS